MICRNEERSVAVNTFNTLPLRLCCAAMTVLTHTPIGFDVPFNLVQEAAGAAAYTLLALDRLDFKRRLHL